MLKVVSVRLMIFVICAGHGSFGYFSDLIRRNRESYSLRYNMLRISYQIISNYINLRSHLDFLKDRRGISILQKRLLRDFT
jgi:hypothetical protein